MSASLTSVLHHHIGPESDFERGLNVCSSLEAYLSHINWLKQRYDIVSLTDLLSDNLPAKPLLLTFDDAFQTSHLMIKEVLAPQGLPCVFFVNPDMLSRDAISLDSALAWASQRVGLKTVCEQLKLPYYDHLSAVIINEMSRLSASERRGVRDQLITTFGPPDLSARAPIMSVKELAELPSLGAEIGNHTGSHVHCRSLTSRELQSEIVDAKRTLEALSGQTVRAFSVPYGHEDDLTEPVLTTLRTSGHKAIFLVHARSNRYRPSSDIWYRVSLHNERPDDLLQEIRIKPALRSIKHWFSVTMFGHK